MTTITRFTKEQLVASAREKVKSLEFAVTQTAFDENRAELEEELELARIALASLESEAVLYAAEETLAYAKLGELHLTCLSEPMGDAVIPLYAAPPAPVVPDEWKQWIADAVEYLEGGLEADGDLEAEGSIEAKRLLSRRAAMLEGKTEPVSNRDELPFDQWLSQQNEQIDVDCGCVTTEAFYHWLRVAYESGNSPVIPDCSCRTCRPVTFADSRFVVCPECGNKRCPHANDHNNACTGSNEPEQEGSAYPAAPQQ